MEELRLGGPLHAAPAVFINLVLLNVDPGF